jgi:iron complex transport system permease protein
VNKALIRLAMIVVALLAMIAVSVSIGAVSIPPRDVARILLGRDLSELDPMQVTIIRELRLPRVLLAMVVGGGLGAAGAGYQGLFRNPLADPFVIGASSGAALGATVAIIMGFSSGAWGLGPVSAAALAGALLAVTLVYGIASVGGRVPTLSLLLAGVAVSSFLGAMVSLLMSLNEENLVTIVGWLMGSLAGRGWETLQATVPLILTGGAALWLCARSLDSLTFGEESARSLGLRLNLFRAVVVVAASLATAGAVAACGIVGFVGLIAPHISRLFVGARHALVIPASAFTGAILLMLADDIARTVAAPGEIPVGIVTALLGSPFFLYVLKTRQRELVQ